MAVRLHGPAISAVELAAASVDTSELKDGALAASAGGRAKMADGFLTAAKHAAGGVDTAALGAGAVTLAKVAAGVLNGTKLVAAPFVQVAVVGRNGAGVCTATGLTVGQRIISVVGLKTDGTGTLVEAKASFESTVTVVDQLQQSSVSDLSTLTYIVTLIPAAS